MINSTQDGEEEVESSQSWNCLSLTSWGIFPIYRAWFSNLCLILGIKYVFPYQGLTFREIRDLETRSSVDKYLFCVFSAFICLSITNFPYAVGWLAGGFEILDELPCSKSLRRHPGFLKRSLRLSYLDNICLVLI